MFKIINFQVAARSATGCLTSQKQVYSKQAIAVCLQLKMQIVRRTRAVLRGDLGLCMPDFVRNGD